MMHGATVFLEPFGEKHLALSREWFNDDQLAKLLDRSRKISEQEHQDWFQSLADQNDFAHFAIHLTENQAHIGNAWLHNIDQKNRKAELRIVIGDVRNTSRGCGSEAIRLLSEYGIVQLNLNKIYAFVLSSNPRARKAFEKAGFALEGLLRQDRWVANEFVDVHVLGNLHAPDPSTRLSDKERVSESLEPHVLEGIK